MKQIFKQLKKLWLTLRYSIFKRDHSTLARKLGVKVGNGCRIIPNPIKVFGTEPFLITLGDYVEITGGVSFVNHDGAIWIFRNLIPEYEHADIFGKITIGNNVFIGIKSIILPGVHIGDNVIIGAGSVITKDCLSNCVYAGVPAKRICSMDEYFDKNKNKIYLSKHIRDKEQWLRENAKELFE